MTPRNLMSLAALAVSIPALGAPTPGLFDTSWLAFDTGKYLQPGEAWYPGEMVVADLNGDGTPDVATANWGNFLQVAPRVSVMFGQPDGTLSQPTAYVTHRAARAIASGDIDHDGDLDLVTSDYGSVGSGTSFSVLRNQGDGTFAPYQDHASGASGPFGLALDDFDGDGWLDVVTTNLGSPAGNGTTVSLILNDGAGGFLAPQVFPAVSALGQVSTGDLDGDGLPDIVVSKQFGFGNLSAPHVMMNMGSGFGPAQQLSQIVSGGGAGGNTSLADIDLDGDLDIIFAELKLFQNGLNSLYAVAIYHNEAGAFGAPVKIPLGSNTGGFSDLEIADVTGDGWPDILGAHDANDAWAIIRSDGAGGFAPFEQLIAGEYPVAIEASDMDGDGDLEVLVTGQYSETVSVHYNEGAGAFTMPSMTTVTGGSYHFDAGDVDGDGDLDLAVSRGYASNGSIDVLINDGAGSLAQAATYEAPVYASSVKLRDLNNDGLADLLWADKYPPYSFRSRLNTGGGSFGATQSWLGTFTCGVSLNADAIQAEDFDNDGDLDPILLENLGCAGGASPKHFYIHANDGAGNFTLVGGIDTVYSGYEMICGDFNGDGNMDVAVTGHTVEVFLGNGDLTFAPGVLYGSVAVPAVHGTCDDVNGDGFLDLVLTGFDTETSAQIPALVVLAGHGDGKFDAPRLTLGSYSPNLNMMTAIVTADPDGDGDRDVLIANYAANDVSFFENAGNGTFAPQIHVGAGMSTRDIVYADFDGDGIDDLVASATRPDNFDVVTVVPARDPNVVEPSVPGDLDGDFDVDSADLNILLGAFGCTGGGCAGDADGDGDADSGDLNIVLGNFGS